MLMKVRGLLPPVGIYTRPREGHMYFKCKPKETLYARFGSGGPFEGHILVQGWLVGEPARSESA